MHGNLLKTGQASKGTVGRETSFNYDLCRRLLKDVEEERNARKKKLKKQTKKSDL